MQDNQYGTVIPSHTHYSTVSLTFFRIGAIPDQQSPEAVSHQSGDYRTTDLPPCWPVRSYRALPECRYCPNWATTDTPESPDYLRHLPAGYSRTVLSAHSLTIAYLQRCPGFHLTAVLRVRAFTVLLFYSYLNYTQTGIPIDLPDYPLNTITKHLYLELNNTIILLASKNMHPSLSRPQQQLNSNRKPRVTSHIPS